MKPIAEEIAELRALDAQQLYDRYIDLYGREPRVKHREYMFKRCAWKVQEQRFGGLSTTAQKRLEELMAEIDEPSLRRVTGKLAKPATTKPGTQIVREWRERRIVVTAVEGGFQFEGAVYRSLTAVAKAVTGTHWNGRKFFGMTGS